MWHNRKTSIAWYVSGTDKSVLYLVTANENISLCIVFLLYFTYWFLLWFKQLGVGHRITGSPYVSWTGVHCIGLFFNECSIKIHFHIDENLLIFLWNLQKYPSLVISDYCAYWKYLFRNKTKYFSYYYFLTSFVQLFVIF